MPAPISIHTLERQRSDPMFSGHSVISLRPKQPDERVSSHAGEAFRIMKPVNKPSYATRNCGDRHRLRPFGGADTGPQKRCCRSFQTDQAVSSNRMKLRGLCLWVRVHLAACSHALSPCVVRQRLPCRHVSGRRQGGVGKVPEQHKRPRASVEFQDVIWIWEPAVIEARLPPPGFRSVAPASPDLPVQIPSLWAWQEAIMRHRSQGSDQAWRGVFVRLP